MNIETYYNAGYYIAELEEPKMQDILDIWGLSWFSQCDEWCTESFGDSDIWGTEPVTGWKRMRNKYYFTEEKQLNWFVIKWAT